MTKESDNSNQPGGLRHIALKSLIALGIYPHIFFRKSPFKIYEFNELLRGTPIDKKDVVLDIGCGRGLQTFLLARRGARAVGVDIEIPDRAFYVRDLYLNPRLTCDFHRGRLEEAGFEAGSFDKVYSICVLEHIPNHDEVLREAFRLLRPGGKLAISVDSMAALEDPALREKHKTEHHVHTYFEPDELKVLLEDCGFKKVEIYPIFVSAYARELFVRKLWDWQGVSLPRALLQYLRLSLAERRTKNRDKGLFLIARAEKAIE